MRLGFGNLTEFLFCLVAAAGSSKWHEWINISAIKCPFSTASSLSVLKLVEASLPVFQAKQLSNLAWDSKTIINRNFWFACFPNNQKDLRRIVLPFGGHGDSFGN
jgi:hypothetical protein